MRSAPPGKGWFRCDIAGHERRVAYLQAAGVPLDRDTAADDLRVRQDRILAPGSTEEMPSLTELAKHWGWYSDTGKPAVKRVRLLLLDEASWSDPRRAEEWARFRARTARHDRGTTRARRGHDQGTPDHGETPEVDDEGHDEGTPGAQQGQDEGNTRDGVAPPSPSPSTSSSPLPPPKAGERRRWVSDRALAELADLTDEAAVARAVERYELGEGALVDTWLRLARPDREAKGRRAWPDAPAGLRAREVVQGLADAGARWRRGERPHREVDDDSDRQLELPEPLPPLRRSAVDEDEVSPELLELVRRMGGEDELVQARDHPEVARVG